VNRAPPATVVHRPANLIDPLDWNGLFERPQSVELELGSGDGSFLARWAQDHPGVNFVGVERLMGRLNKLDRKARRLGLRNLRLLRFEAAYLMKYLVPAESLDAVHVYFPDPWPKRKHVDRRLINSAFTVMAARALKPGGTVWLRTDHTEYFAQMQDVFSASGLFTDVDTPFELAQVITDFERDFNGRGIPTCRSGWRLAAART